MFSTGSNGWQDTASYAEASTGVTVDLAISGPQNTGEGSDTLIGIENLTGSAFGDTLKGTSGDNVLIGGAGDDMLVRPWRLRTVSTAATASIPSSTRMPRPACRSISIPVQSTTRTF